MAGLQLPCDVAFDNCNMAFDNCDVDFDNCDAFRKMSNVCILGYWDIRGLAEPIRLLLEHVEANYEDRR